MGAKRSVIFFSIIFCLIFSLQSTTAIQVKPVTPDASPEAAALLNLLYSISGKFTLTGQHNYPNIRDRNSRFAKKYIGKTPAVSKIKPIRK